MTKKHFIALAEVLTRYNGLDTHLNKAFNVGASTIQSSGDKAMTLLAVKDAAFADLANLLADFCQSQNAQFDRARWLAYIAGECGPNGGTR